MYSAAEDIDHEPIDFSRRSPIVDAELRRMWWRLRCRFGVPLPPERGLILIDGGRS